MTTTNTLQSPEAITPKEHISATLTTHKKQEEVQNILAENAEFSHTITREETEIISNGIAEENKIKQHMVPISADEILAIFKNEIGLVARVDGKIAGMIKLSKMYPELNVWERGSLFVLPEFRKHGIANKLIRTVNSDHKDLSIVSITCVPRVITINTLDPEQQIIDRKSIGKLFAALEGPAPLANDDLIFANKTLIKRVHRGDFN